MLNSNFLIQNPSGAPAVVPLVPVLGTQVETTEKPKTTESQLRRLERIRKRNAERAASVVATTPIARVQCGAESFKLALDPVLRRESKEDWIRCNNTARPGDVLCPVHRKMLNSACAHAGFMKSKTRVRVPADAVNMGGCGFPPTTFNLMKDNHGNIPKQSSSITAIQELGNKVAIDNFSHLLAAFLAKHGSE